MLQQLADGDRFGVRQQPRQVVVDRSIEVDLPVRDEAEHQSRRERLGDAANPELAGGAWRFVGAKIPYPGHDRPGTTIIARLDGDARYAGRDDPARLLQQR